jgi:dsDNA-specific endonuclease/ATPase MutS2
VKKGSATFVKTSAPVRLELDVRGQTGDDAWFMVDRYIDDAIRNNTKTSPSFTERAPAL